MVKSVVVGALISLWSLLDSVFVVLALDNCGRSDDTGSLVCCDVFVVLCNVFRLNDGSGRQWSPADGFGGRSVL